jgi:coenzyme A diphosphatase NUDT7
MILDNTLTPLLNADEVTSLFSHPLRSFLSSDPPFPGDFETLELEYHTTTDVPWEGDRNRTIRMHRFLTGREAGGTKPVYGLTAYVNFFTCLFDLCYPAELSYRAIMIRTATIGFAQYPLFELESPGQPSMSERMTWVFAKSGVFRKAARDEGIDPDQMLRTLEGERRQKAAKRKENWRQDRLGKARL